MKSFINFIVRLFIFTIVARISFYLFTNIEDIHGK